VTRRVVGRWFAATRVGDDVGTKDALDEEPRRPGPPVTGPGVQHNEVITSQYTVQNFIFKNLWKQFHRPANCYFLFISGLQCIKVSDSCQRRLKQLCLRRVCGILR
jgi:hypothetical protein